MTIIFHASFSLQHVHDVVATKSKRRINKPTGMPFSIYKMDRRMDRFGVGQKELFHVVSFIEILNYVKWELLENHLFVVSDRVLSQKRGVAIWGALSAELSSVYCMIREHRFYNASLQRQRRRMIPHVPPHVFSSKPFRFSDNLVGISLYDMNLAKAQELFQSLYGLKLQAEGEWQRLQTLCKIPGHRLPKRQKCPAQPHPRPRNEMYVLCLKLGMGAVPCEYDLI